MGTIADPRSADGRGLCCATLFELPQQVGDMPAGTLLWAASFGQDESDRRMPIRVFKSTEKSDTVDFCPNYSSSLLPSADGSEVLEAATDYDGEVCRLYYATNDA
ncbi:hypothetical protein [Streptomyces hygroscopicus]|uniref:hypothetical protein n=1 Tax=Streptomyces hygroscopicus TaxID=1912 RepID=UPI0004C61903